MGSGASKQKLEDKKELNIDTQMDELEFSQMGATFLNTDGGEQLKEPTQLFQAKTQIKDKLKEWYDNVDGFFQGDDDKDVFYKKMKRLWSNLELGHGSGGGRKKRKRKTRRKRKKSSTRKRKRKKRRKSKKRRKKR